MRSRSSRLLPVESFGVEWSVCVCVCEGEGDGGGGGVRRRRRGSLGRERFGCDLPGSVVLGGNVASG